MNVKKLQTNLQDILTINPITKKIINRGYRCELAYKADQEGYVNYALDNKINTEYGDFRKNNLIYQIKSNKCELKLAKRLNIIANTFEDILINYIKFEKANRYVYIIEHEDNLYAITMNEIEFMDFVYKFGTYSHSGNSIRIYKSDSLIWRALQGC